MTIYKIYKDEMNVEILRLPLPKLKLSQKSRFFYIKLNHIHEQTSCIPGSDSMLLIAVFFRTADELLQKRKVVLQSTEEPTKSKNTIRIMKSADPESSVYEIGKSILLFLCLFKTQKFQNASNCQKLKYRKPDTIEPLVWKAIISETILNIFGSPCAAENHLFFQSLFKLRLNRMDSLMSPESSLKKLYTKQSKPKENDKGHLADSINLIFAVLGWSDDNPTGTIEMFDAAAQKWSFFQRETPFMRAYHGVALLGCNLYIVGGYNGNACLPTMLCLNLKSRRWSKKSPMFMPRCYIFTLTYRGYIYVFGGHNGENRLKSCERYDPKRNKWIRITDMMFRRSDAAGAELNGRIFVCGGFDGFHFHYAAEMYDPENDEWTMIGNLINPRSGHSMVSFDGQLFVLGGFNGLRRLQEVEIYNEETDEWEFYIPMLVGRSNFGCVVLKHKIYVIGGYNGLNTIADVEIFNQELMDWQRAPCLNVHRSAVRACVISNYGKINACDLKEFVPVVSANIEEPSP